MDAAALDDRRGPPEADGLAQPGVPVDHAPDGGDETARAEVVQTRLPRRERLAPRAEVRATSCFWPSVRTATTPRAGTLTTLPALLTRSARASR